MIRVFEPKIGTTESRNVLKALKNGLVSSSGPAVFKFEKKWANYCNRKYGISVSNGTVALELALKILNIRENSEIIMPSNTIISCAMAAVYNKLKIVPIDCKFDNWCIDENLIEKYITKKTKAILIVNIFGHPCNMDVIKKIAKKYKLYLIEDAAESHGSKYKGKICGSFGDISTFSFYANKLITTGEGGMLVTNSKKFHEKALYYRNLCFNTSQRFKHLDLGYNFRFTNIQAEIGLGQLKQVKQLIKKKIYIAESYINNFKNQNFFNYVKNSHWAFNTYWMFGILIKNKLVSANKFAKKLNKFGIETRPFFYGLHKQPCLKYKYIKKTYCPNVDYMSDYGLYLPSGYNLNKKKINYISKNVLKIFNEIR